MTDQRGGEATNRIGCTADSVRPTMETDSYTKIFSRVHASELECIASRRARLAVDTDTKPADRRPLSAEDTVVDTVGLSLSGGGIRSAAFCLGALQALDALPKPPGGGARSAADARASLIDRIDYLSTVSGGGYIGAAMSTAMAINRGAFPFRSALDQEETPSLQHIRDHSNYLFPRDSKIATVAIYLRGLLVNIFLVMPWLFLAAALLLAYHATLHGIDGYLYAFAAVAAVLLLWGLERSRPGRTDASDVRSQAPRRIGFGVVAAACVCAIGISAAALDLLARYSSEGGLATFAVSLAPLSGVLGIVAPRVAAALGKAATGQALRFTMSRVFGFVVVWIGAAIVPLLLWIVVLLLARAAMCNVWPAVFGYLAVGLVTAAIGLLFSSNANSLHRLYRDRLSAAFLFDPRLPSVQPAGGDWHHLQPSLEPADGFQLHEDSRNPPGQGSGDPPGGLTADRGPYHLINAAVNVQNSKYVNKRGRNADFFMFSRNFTGSESTGYVKTTALVKEVPALDLGTAVALSGAAVSSNMGANSIAPLTLTLAMLNVRLGYWLLNPRNFGLNEGSNIAGGSKKFWKEWYFWKEAFGRLNENLRSIYISDGGHIDNLGIYELLKRRCRLIIAIDSEADAELDFNSLIAVERHARIDLGIRIDLPWQAIRDASGRAAAGAQPGPHAAVGRINYSGEDDTGVLVYIKASVTGDESDIIRDYKRRYPKFPHETTLDQFFSEEQFEVYRALGFHATYRLFNGVDKVAVAAAPGCFVPDVAQLIHPSIGIQNPLLDTMRSLLGLPAAAPEGAPTKVVADSGAVAILEG
ncbi:MAG TPA: patatin-like phospholipase family protein [Xanthobacteraceae bacterium]|nr:patatin-like phospholipase family protein [Xanthobacteraceae bacterium]